jgi:beta-N-acetylhexosaminidase
MSIDKKIGQMLMIGFHGNQLTDQNIISLTKQIKNGDIGGIIVLGYNITSDRQIRELIHHFKSIPSEYPLFISIDQEGGKISRLKSKNGFINYPSQKEVAETKSLSQAYTIYDNMARTLKDIGFNINFAPVVDVNIDIESPVIGKLNRSFSDNPQIVVDYAIQSINAHYDNKIIPCIKHYPGHGSAKTDSHKELSNITNTWQSSELYPYEQLINHHKIDMIMSGHLYNINVDKDYPASLSEKHIKSILRNKLNYNKVIITDDLQMGAIQNNFDLKTSVIQSIKAGNDILLFSNYKKFTKLDHNLHIKIKRIINDAVNDNELSTKLIDKSFSRIINLKHSLK